MNGYFALLKLQLINRFADLKPRNLKNALKEKKGRSIAAILGIVLNAILPGNDYVFEEEVQTQNPMNMEI